MRQIKGQPLTKVLLQVGRTEDKWAANRYCTVSGLDGILLNIFLLTYTFIAFSAVVPGWTSNKFPACSNTRSLADIAKSSILTLAIMKKFCLVMTILSFCSCNNNQSNKTVDNLSAVPVLNDAFTINNKKTEGLINKYRLRKISDSIKVRIYRLLYDKEIGNDSIPNYFCYYDLAPLHFDSFPNWEFRIEYILLSPDSNYAVLSSYIAKNGNDKFTEKNLMIPGSYLVDRRELKDTGFIPFVEKNRSKVNRWLLNELSH